MEKNLSINHRLLQESTDPSPAIPRALARRAAAVSSPFLQLLRNPRAELPSQ